MLHGNCFLTKKVTGIFTTVMPKDILLYGHISQYNALYFMEQIKEALKDDPEAQLTMRMTTDGGSPEYGMSVIEKVKEMKDQMLLKVGAMAHSMGLFIMIFLDADQVECLDTTQAVLHRAAYPDWVEGSDTFKDSIFAEILAKMNKDMEKALRARVDVEVLEALPAMKGLKVKDIFSMESRHNVLLTTADLKKLGLVGKVNKIIPAKSAQMKALTEKFNACTSLEEFRMAASAAEPKSEDPKPTTMTPEEFKAKHPEAYASIVKTAIDDERDRVGAWLAYADIDKDAVIKGINDGAKLSQKAMAEFNVKQMSSAKLGKLEADGKKIAGKTGETQDDPTEKTEAQINLEKFEAVTAKGLGLKKATTPAA